MRNQRVKSPTRDVSCLSEVAGYQQQMTSGVQADTLLTRASSIGDDLSRYVIVTIYPCDKQSLHDLYSRDCFLARSSQSILTLVFLVMMRAAHRCRKSCLSVRDAMIARSN
jgi:hypothetical protein